MLGICFGHQVIGQALGGEVTVNPRGREIGTVRVDRKPGARDLLIDGLGESFFANCSHRDTVARLPEGARVLASTDLEPHAIFAIGDTTRGVQFHPEFDGDVMRGYIAARESAIRSEGLDYETILARAVDADGGRSTLPTFVRSFAKPAAGAGA